ncbi:hypothetical protein [Limosilactobacillus mucosae]|uniref:hypothetical protein n=1 Tax=Limosilactobacillus mucosae TaxID=97478 RepID=UPI000FFC1053|nr:hypothetical protein [Limosilactobacillus mucosae]RXA58161.1 hypothetical protein EQ839_02935 [Limosilactobacillus mucosae]
MAKYYDIYTQIPGIKPCPQKWVVTENILDVNRGFLNIYNIAATNVKELSNVETILLNQEYFIYMVESQYEGEHHE